MLIQPATWLAFVTLSLLEIVLGIDNIIFICDPGGAPAAASGSARARIGGLALAMLTRIALLFSIVWLTRLTQPWFTSGGQERLGARPDPARRRPVPARQERARDPSHARGRRAGRRAERAASASFVAIVVQIALIDIVFSLDSVFTAVGLARPTCRSWSPPSSCRSWS